MEQNFLTILVVDDDPNMFNLIKIYLSSENYQLQSARTGRQAIHLLETNEFDVILSDVLMPEMNGITFIKEARTMTKSNALFIMVTAHGLENHFMKVLDEGVFDIIQKPFTSSRLKLTLRNALNYKFLLDEYNLLKKK